MQLDDTHATNKIFGGKIVVLGGDFRQILHVVLKGGRKDIVSASIASLAACYNSSSSYQHASHGSQF
jgi:hypothetical protein